MILKTPIHNWHIKNKARMVEYAGWEMPMNFTSIIEEHNAVREHAGLFDVCHMGRLRVKGPDRIQFMNYICTNDIETLGEGKVQYSFLCNADGGIIDDITVYKSEEYILIICNAINRERVVDWLNANKRYFNVFIEDETASLSMIAIQGPAAEFILQEITTPALNTIKYYNFTLAQVKGAKALISRTGYTGEDGFEIYLGMLYINPIWEKLIEIGKSKGLKPIGLGARDTLRVEACLPLYGNEMDDYTTPIEIGFDRFVKFQKRDFMGRKGLLHSTSSEFSKRLVAFEMVDKGIPRKDFQIYKNDVLIGKVTSGIFSPTLNRGVGMGFIDQLSAKVGTNIEIRHESRRYEAVIAARPLYKRRR